MQQRALITAAFGVLFVGTIVGCAPPSSGDDAASHEASKQSEESVIAPVTVGVNELEGSTVELITGQVLNIDTESLDVDSYVADIADPTIVEFSQGSTDESAEFNPGLTALAEGETLVTLVNEQGGIQPLVFNVTVSSH